jgi:hypothetical protein
VKHGPQSLEVESRCIMTLLEGLHIRQDLP